MDGAETLPQNFEFLFSLEMAYCSAFLMLDSRIQNHANWAKLLACGCT